MTITHTAFPSSSLTDTCFPSKHSKGSDGPTSSQSTTYCGTNPKDGSFRVIIKGKKAKVYGAAFELVRHDKASGKLGMKRRKIGVTPGYEQGAEGEVNFVAQCPKTKKRYRIIGLLSYCVPKTNAPALVVSVEPRASNDRTEAVMAAAVEAALPDATQRVDSPVALVHPEGPVLTSVVMKSSDDTDTKKRERDQRQLQAFERELQSIAAQRAAGFDPLMSMPTFCRMANRSHATVYRDIQDGILMKPIKNGRKSLQPYSVAEAYMAGHQRTTVTSLQGSAA